MTQGTMEMIQLIANVLVIPMVTALWGMNMRISKLEGKLEAYFSKKGD